MDKPLPAWLLPCLSRPAWQLVAIQWGILAGLVFCLGRLFLAGEWQQREALDQQRQQHILQIAEYQQQLGQLPTLAQLESQLQPQATKSPTEKKSIGSKLYQVGGVILLWRQQEKQQQRVKFRLEYAGLLRFLEGFPPDQRIYQMAIARQPEGLVTQLVLQAPEGGGDE